MLQNNAITFAICGNDCCRSVSTKMHVITNVNREAYHQEYSVLFTYAHKHLRPCKVHAFARRCDRGSRGTLQRSGNSRELWLNSFFIQHACDLVIEVRGEDGEIDSNPCHVVLSASVLLDRYLSFAVNSSLISRAGKNSWRYLDS